MPPSTTSPAAAVVHNLHVAILIGPPGSGKSTYVEELKKLEDARDVLERRMIFTASADDYFVVDGEYKFDPSMLRYAHGDCMLRFASFLHSLSQPSLATMRATIVVDNTNSSLLEIAPYYALASAYRASIELVHFDAHPRACAERQRHGVPAARVEAMWKAARDIEPPPYWEYSERVIVDDASYRKYLHVTLPA